MRAAKRRKETRPRCLCRFTLSAANPQTCSRPIPSAKPTQWLLPMGRGRWARCQTRCSVAAARSSSLISRARRCSTPAGIVGPTRRCWLCAAPAARPTHSGLARFGQLHNTVQTWSATVARTHSTRATPWSFRFPGPCGEARPRFPTRTTMRRFFHRCNPRAPGGSCARSTPDVSRTQEARPTETRRRRLKRRYAGAARATSPTGRHRGRPRGRRLPVPGRGRRRWTGRSRGKARAALPASGFPRISW
mmetsp:Transcript_18869/g.42569  ORF Transcript_18869/g.42569 Transcript_18869/m.42569 type:complete len:248 (-) Transcript_18869:534-1277(-)